MSTELFEDSSSAPAGLARQLVWISATTGYIFYRAAATFAYRKTTDGGATFGAAVTIYSNTIPASFDVWYDRWTEGDTTGTEIHMTWSALFGATDAIFYRGLNTSGDTFTQRRTIENASTTGQPNIHTCSITKARGGNLYVLGARSNAVHGFWRSTNGGVAWSSRTVGMSNIDDRVQLYYGNETDNQDIWAVVFDAGSQIEFMVHDDSANTWSVTNIRAAPATYINFAQFGGAQRHSDGSLFLCIWPSAALGSTADVELWQIVSSASITQRTDLKLLPDNIFGVGVLIDQGSGRIWVAYSHNPSTDTTGDVLYRTSDDDGVTWGTERNHKPDDDVNSINIYLDSSVLAGDGGLFYIIFGEQTTNDYWTDLTSVLVLSESLNAIGDYWLMDSVSTKPTISAQSALLKESNTRDVFYYDGAAWQLFSRWNGSKGTDVSSGGTITLTEDDRYFDVTGTTTIDHITIGDFTAGDQVIFQFDASVTVTHNAGAPPAGTAAILLSGAGDFSATLDDTLTLIYDGSTWRETARTVI